MLRVFFCASPVPTIAWPCYIWNFLIFLQFHFSNKFYLSVYSTTLYFFHNIDFDNLLKFKIEFTIYNVSPLIHLPKCCFNGQRLGHSPRILLETTWSRCLQRISHSLLKHSKMKQLWTTRQRLLPKMSFLLMNRSYWIYAPFKTWTEEMSLISSKKNIS